MIQNKITISYIYNASFQNKMHHIFRILKLEFTIFGLLFHIFCFGIYFFDCIGLDYHITNNNTFCNIIINNLTKLYNITCIFFYSRLYISNKTTNLFLKKYYLVYTSLIWWIQTLSKFNPNNTRTTKVIINAQK